MYEILVKCPLFKGLDKNQIENNFNNILFRKKQFEKDTLIEYSGNICNNLLIILNGTVKCEMTDIEGKVVKIDQLESPYPVAPAFIFGKNNRFPVNVISVTDCSILYIAKDSLLQLLCSDKNILLNYLNIVSDRAQFLSYKMKFLNFNTIRRKFLSYLFHLSGGRLTPINIPQSRQGLADFFGVARQSLARVINELEEEKIIKISGKEIHILDFEHLKKSISL